MGTIDRRGFIRLAGGAGAASGLGLGATGPLLAKTGGGGHVVVVGGGAGGATCAKYIRKLDPSIRVTLIEPKAAYATCFMSNWVIGGLKKKDYIAHGYEALASRHGVQVVHDRVTEIDAAAKRVKTASGKTLRYERCVVSPGIDFRWDRVEGFSQADSESIPHAWEAGAQTDLLRKQLVSMPDGGTFVIVPPPNPFRCPPGPAERISLVANYFMKSKPRSKIIAVDVKGKFSKQGLFKDGWAKLYPGMIDYRHQTEVEEISVRDRRVVTGVDEVKADVLNFIPAQKAGAIAHAAGLTDDSGWCPVHHQTWESKLRPGVHVVGDAALASPLPKSAYAANSEAKVCAAAIVALLNGDPPPEPSWVNTCYSLVGPGYGISVAMVYRLKDGRVSKVKGSGGLTPKDGMFALEAVFAESWYRNIVDDMFG